MEKYLLNIILLITILTGCTLKPSYDYIIECQDLIINDGKIEEANKVIDKLLKKDSNYAPAWIAKGVY